MLKDLAMLHELDDVERNAGAIQNAKTLAMLFLSRNIDLGLRRRNGNRNGSVVIKIKMRFYGHGIIPTHGGGG